MTRSATRKEFVPFSSTDTFQAALEVVKKLNWTVGARTNPAISEIHALSFVYGMLDFWGEDITIRILPEKNGSSIEMTSNTRGIAISDGGANLHNINSFFSQLGFEFSKLHVPTA